MQEYLNINGKKINNCLIGEISGINSLKQKVNYNGFYFLGKNPCEPFDSTKAFHIAFFQDGKWNYFKPNDGFMTFSLETKKIYLYSSKNGWILI